VLQIKQHLQLLIFKRNSDESRAKPVSFRLRLAGDNVRIAYFRPDWPVNIAAEPLQVAMDNGARKALIPLENKRNFLDVSGEIVERVDPVFFSDPMTAAMKALGMT
jgi:ATP-dependent Lon protease